MVMRKQSFLIALSSVAVAISGMVGLFSLQFQPLTADVGGFKCASIYFGTELGGTGTTPIKEENLTYDGIAAALDTTTANFINVTSKSDATIGKYAAKIGGSSKEGKIRFSFPLTSVLSFTVYARRYSTNSPSFTFSTYSESTQVDTSLNSANFADFTAISIPCSGTAIDSFSISVISSNQTIYLSDIAIRIAGTGGQESSVSSSITNQTSPIEIHMLEMGNANSGDCIFVKAGDNDILIDAGSKSNSVSSIVPRIKELCSSDGKLEYVVATHAHLDHIAGFAASNGVFSSFDIGTIIDFPKTNSTSQTYQTYVSKRDELVSLGTTNHYTALECYSNDSIGTSGACRKYSLGENLWMEILYNPYYETYSSSGENDYSVCLRFIQGDNHYLFLGDCEDLSEKRVVAQNALSHCVFYKADHHGSKTSSCPTLMSTITPTYVGIQAAVGNYEYSQSTYDYTFPCQRTINSIAPYTYKIMATTLGDPSNLSSFSSLNGEIVVSSSGPTEGDVSMRGLNNSTYLKDSTWFNAVGNQVDGYVDEGEAGSYKHTSTDSNRRWPVA